MSSPDLQTVPPSRTAGTVMACAVLLGLLATYLFYKRPFGISMLIFVLAGTTILSSLAWQNKIKPAWRNAWLVLPILLFASLVAVRANVFTTFLNISAVVSLSLLLAYLFQSGDIFKFGILNYLSAGVKTGVEIGIIRPPTTGARAWKEAQQDGGISPRLAAILRGLLLALPIIMIFTFLFSSADAAFDQATRDFLKLLRLDNIPELVMRLVFTTIVAWLCLGGLAYALRTIEPTPETAGKTSQAKGHLGSTETAVILAGVNALFATFVAIQFRYFFGGQNNISVAGFTYAEYTRRGFAELVFVAIFTLVLCLVLQAVTRRDSTVARWGFECLVGLLVTFTGVILVSAFQRLVLYETAYGWTQLRTYVHIFMISLGFLLAVFLLSVHFANPRIFAFGFFLTCLGFVFSLNVLNTDAFIARQNIHRYAADGKLDVVYLATLSEDAVPELIWLLDAVGNDDAQVIGSALHDRLNRLEEIQKQAGWPGWNWSRARAYSLLQKARPVLEQYPARQFHWNFPIN